MASLGASELLAVFGGEFWRRVFGASWEASRAGAGWRRAGRAAAGGACMRGAFAHGFARAVPTARSAPHESCRAQGTALALLPHGCAPVFKVPRARAPVRLPPSAAPGTAEGRSCGPKLCRAGPDASFLPAYVRCSASIAPLRRRPPAGKGSRGGSNCRAAHHSAHAAGGSGAEQRRLRSLLGSLSAGGARQGAAGLQAHVPCRLPGSLAAQQAAVPGVPVPGGALPQGAGGRRAGRQQRAAIAGDAPHPGACRPAFQHRASEHRAADPLPLPAFAACGPSWCRKSSVLS